MSAGQSTNQVDKQDADLKALEVRGRVAGVFADSVVSDDEAGYPFRNRRERHLRGVDLHTCTSPRCVIGIRGGESSAWPFFDGPIDAPEWMASGASEWSWSPLERVSFVVRGSWK